MMLDGFLDHAGWDGVNPIKPITSFRSLPDVTSGGTRADDTPIPAKPSTEPLIAAPTVHPRARAFLRIALDAARIGTILLIAALPAGLSLPLQFPLLLASQFWRIVLVKIGMPAFLRVRSAQGDVGFVAARAVMQSPSLQRRLVDRNRFRSLVDQSGTEVPAFFETKIVRHRR